MSHYARQLLVRLDRDFKEAAFWHRYAASFTPEERRKLGEHRGRLVRPLEPDLRPGWLVVSHNFEVHIVSVKPHKGRWQIIVDHIRDFRAPASQCALGPLRTRESLSGVATLAGVEGKRTGEPEGVPTDYHNVLEMQAHSRFAEHRSEEQRGRAAERDLQRLQGELRELAKRAAKLGVPVEEVLAPIAKGIAAQHGNLRDAA